MALKRHRFNSKLAVFAMAMLVWGHPGQASVNRKVGIQLLSYQNVHGQLPDGTCCDGQRLPGGTCVPDSCDTAFVLCIRHHSNGSTCDPSVETSALRNNNTVTQFGKKINANDVYSTPSLLVVSVSTMEDIQVTVDVVEVNPPFVAWSGSNMGHFSMVLNTTHLFTPHPDWQTYHFDNSVVRLSVNVTSFCSRHFYGPDCDISCRPLDNFFGHFACDDNGNKVCKEGYEGNSCTTITDLCVSSPCHNGAPCQPRLNDFYCSCPPGYTGKICDVALPTTTTITTTTTTTTTTISTPTTTVSDTSLSTDSVKSTSTIEASPSVPINIPSTPDPDTGPPVTVFTTSLQTSSSTSSETTGPGTMPTTTPQTAPEETTSSVPITVFNPPKSTTTQLLLTSSTSVPATSQSATTSTGSSTSTHTFPRSTASSRNSTTVTFSRSRASSSASSQESSSGSPVGVIVGPLAGVTSIGAASLLLYKVVLRKRGRTISPKRKPLDEDPEEVVEDRGENQGEPQQPEHPPSSPPQASPEMSQMPPVDM